MKRASTLAGKSIIVTGGAASLGMAISCGLAERGASVAITDRDKNGAESLAADIMRQGGTAIAIGADVMRREDLEKMISTTLDRFGRIDGLVNNAGMLGPIKPFWETSDEEVERVFDLNVRAVFSATRCVVPHMIKAGRGSIVTIASVAGKDGPKAMSIYSSSKAAVIGFTKSWAKELAEHGVRANCVSPSLIEATGMQGEMPSWFSSDSVSRIPLGRAARAAEVANVVAFLLSDEASFVTGTCYDVSGGRASF